MKQGHSYDFYYNIEIVGGLLVLIVTVIAILICICGFGLSRNEKYIIQIVKIVFPTVNKKNTLIGVEVHKCYIVLLSILLALIIGLGAYIFWINSLIQNSSYCDPYDDFDCFNATSSHERIDNCSDDANVLCYKIPYNFVGAVGQVTAILALSWAGAALHLGCILKCGKKVLETETKKKYGLIICQMVFATIWFIIPIVAAILLILQRISLSLWLEILFFCILMVMVSFTPWCIVIKKKTTPCCCTGKKKTTPPLVEPIELTLTCKKIGDNITTGNKETTSLSVETIELGLTGKKIGDNITTGNKETTSLSVETIELTLTSNKETT